MLNMTETEQIQVQAYREMGAARKLELSAELRRLAWEVKAAALRRAQPDLDEGAIQARVRELFRGAGG